MLTLDPCPFQYLERPLTPQRLAAARRALERERQRLPLFASDITQTAEERKTGRACDGLSKIFNA